MLHGATGFVGKQTVQYFAQHTRPAQVRWAIAGQNRQKLESAKAQVGTVTGKIQSLSNTMLLDTWVGPFFMSPVNTRVVRRSYALFEQWQEPYGPDFTYQEYLKFNPPLAWLQAMGVTAGMALFTSMAQQAPLRRLLQALLPQPGSGPSEQTMDEGWFRCELLGVASNGGRVQGLICDQGDPGNRATVKFLCESALSLALETERLPGGHQRGGILTPATGLGEVLAERLRKAGMTLEFGVV